MKQLFIILLLPIAFIYGQQNWKWINPLPQGKSINDIKAFDSLTAFAVGDNSVFLKTTDGGSSWNVTENQFNRENLYSVFFRDKLNGWACGENGLIIQTEDGGLTFQKDSSFTVNNLYCIASNGSRLFAAGANSTLLLSDDNGITWNKKDIPFNAGFTTVKFISSNIGILACSDGKILRTSDGGDNWTASNIPVNNNIISSVAFSDANSGWACGQNGFIVHTTDGGMNWAFVNSPSNKWLTSVSFSDNNNGIIASKEGVYLLTSNGGNTWNSYKQDSTFSFNSVSLLSSGTGWLAGSSGLLNKTTDNGSSWEFQSSGERTNFTNIKFFGANFGVILGEKGLLLKSTDGGNTWIKKNTGTSLKLYDITYYAWSHSFYVAAANGTVFTSNDYGETWDSVIYRNFTKDDFTSIGCSQYFLLVGGQHGKCIVKGMKFIYNLNASLYPAGNNSINSIFMRGNSGFAAGDGGYLYFLNMPAVFKDGSAPIIKAMSLNFTIGDLNDVFFSKNSGWAVGKYGVLLTTKNNTGNKSPWQKQIINITDARSVFFTDTLTGYVCGSDGVILKSSDGGSSWNVLHSNTTSLLKKMFFISDQTGFIIGNNGMLIRTDNGGESTSLTGSNDEKPFFPVTSLLKQNYPNPFNPSTVISFYNNKDQNVILKVYDILGKEVKTLLSDFITKGEHNVQFTPNNLTSGVYFYTLKAGEYFETRKMLFIK